jgi:two-component system response regulator PfeR
VIRVLVIHPDTRTAASLARALADEKMMPTVVCDRSEALRQLDSNPPDAVILAAVPCNGWSEDLCRAVCRRTLVPLLVVAALEDNDLVQQLLAAGADAHVLEPLAAEVLVAQLWALLRRVGLVSNASTA